MARFGCRVFRNPPAAEPLVYTSTSPIYGGGARRAEGALAKVALIVSSNILQPLRGKTPPPQAVPLPLQARGGK